MCGCTGTYNTMCRGYVFFFFRQKTAYELRISDWSSDVCSSDLLAKRLTLYRLRRPIVIGRDDALAVHWSAEGEAGRDRKSVVYGKSVSVRVDLGGRRMIKKKK